MTKYKVSVDAVDQSSVPLKKETLNGLKGKTFEEIVDWILEPSPDKSPLERETAEVIELATKSPAPVVYFKNRDGYDQRVDLKDNVDQYNNNLFREDVDENGTPEKIMQLYVTENAGGGSCHYL